MGVAASDLVAGPQAVSEFASASEPNGSILQLRCMRCEGPGPGLGSSSRGKSYGWEHKRPETSGSHDRGRSQGTARGGNSRCTHGGR